MDGGWVIVALIIGITAIAAIDLGRKRGPHE